MCNTVELFNNDLYGSGSPEGRGHAAKLVSAGPLDLPQDVVGQRSPTGTLFGSKQSPTQSPVQLHSQSHGRRTHSAARQHIAANSSCKAARSPQNTRDALQAKRGPGAEGLHEAREAMAAEPAGACAADTVASADKLHRPGKQTRSHTAQADTQAHLPNQHANTVSSSVAQAIGSAARASTAAPDALLEAVLSPRQTRSGLRTVALPGPPAPAVSKPSVDTRPGQSLKPEQQSRACGLSNSRPSRQVVPDHAADVAHASATETAAADGGHSNLQSWQRSVESGRPMLDHSRLKNKSVRR